MDLLILSILYISSSYHFAFC